ncbi:MAG: hypothetical protein R3C15_23200 [Thermoleophilia bacterium]
MSGDEDVREGEVEAIFARLQAEVRRSSPQAAEAASATPAAPLASRATAERLWVVMAGVPGGGGPAGLVKKVVHKLTRWNVEPLAASQRDFNLTVLRLVDELTDRVGRLERAAAARREDEPPAGA